MMFLLCKMLHHTYEGNSNYNTLCLLQCILITFVHVDISKIFEFLDMIDILPTVIICIEKDQLVVTPTG